MDTETQLALAIRALESIQGLLSDWPTMRALSALGAQNATARKVEARSIIMDTLAAMAKDA